MEKKSQKTLQEILHQYSELSFDVIPPSSVMKVHNV